MFAYQRGTRSDAMFGQTNNPPPVRKRQLLSPFRKPKITSLPLTLEIPSIYMKQTFFYGKFRHINGFVVYIVAIQAIT